MIHTILCFLAAWPILTACGSQAVETSLPADIPVVLLICHGVLHEHDHTDDMKAEPRGLIYTIAAYEPGPVHFVIFTGTPGADVVSSWFAGCPTHRITYETIVLDVKMIVQHIHDLRIVGRTPLEHHGGIGQAAKVFIPEIIPHVKKVIYIDTDVVVNDAISNLWKEFQKFSTEEAVGVTLLDEGGDRRHNLCSCLMLMDLQKMRSLGWRSGTPLFTTLFNGVNVERTYQNGISDQALYTAAYTKYPMHFRILGHQWMLSKCQNFFGKWSAQELCVYERIFTSFT